MENVSLNNRVSVFLLGSSNECDNWQYSFRCLCSI